jgi:inosine-uridine nucleoside N-ribohydrolase
MSRHRIILGRDSGVDDAVAILLAISSAEEMELVGVTTIAGKRELAMVDRNAQRLLAFAGVGRLPVAAGCRRPGQRRVRFTSYDGAERRREHRAESSRPVAQLPRRHARLHRAAVRIAGIAARAPMLLWPRHKPGESV